LAALAVAGAWLAAPAVASQSSSPPVRTIEPVDHAAGEPGFARFRADVRAAAAVCTEASLRSILAPSTTGSGAHFPPSRAFWRYWKIDDMDGLPGLCRIFERAMALGAVTYGDGVYCAPYLSCGAVPRDFPVGVHPVGVVERVEIRSRPSAMASMLAHARYPVLANCRSPEESCGRSLDEPPEGWWLVRLDATVGYVTDAQVRDQIEPRLIVRRLPVGWRITALEFYD
jgi:hypothetical protein